MILASVITTIALALLLPYYNRKDLFKGEERLVHIIVALTGVVILCFAAWRWDVVINDWNTTATAQQQATDTPPVIRLKEPNCEFKFVNTKPGELQIEGYPIFVNPNSDRMEFVTSMGTDRKLISTSSDLYWAKQKACMGALELRALGIKAMPQEAGEHQ